MVLLTRRIRPDFLGVLTELCIELRSGDFDTGDLDFFPAFFRDLGFALIVLSRPEVCLFNSINNLARIK